MGQEKQVATEEQEHLALMDWIKLYPFLERNIIHIPNGGSRFLLEAVKLKKMGVKPGVSDLFLCLPISNKSGLWIELKSKNGKISPSQKEWLTRMRANGYSAEVAYGCDEAIRIISDYVDSYQTEII